MYRSQNRINYSRFHLTCNTISYIEVKQFDVLPILKVLSVSAKRMSRAEKAESTA